MRNRIKPIFIGMIFVLFGFGGIAAVLNPMYDVFGQSGNDGPIYLPIFLKGSSPAASPTPPSPPVNPAGTFLETFDGDPSTPTPFGSFQWDIAVHTRNKETFYQLTSMDAGHGPNCEPPPATHVVDSYEETVYQCRNHLMTAIHDDAYGAIYLTPNHLVDFSDGEAIIRFNMSTERTSFRDWVDIWITPFDQNLQLPVPEFIPDLQGPPKNAVLMEMQSGNVFVPTIFRNFQGTKYDFGYAGVDVFTSYEMFLEPSAMRRDVFELRISRDHIKFGMPEYDFYWVDLELDQPLEWSQGIVQFGHHSYTPTKACEDDGTCGPNTWHWDNFEINPAIPFTLIHGDRRFVNRANNLIQFDSAAPADAFLRFSAIGQSIEVSFDDGGTWQTTQKADQKLDDEGHFASYWTPIPEGVRKVRVRGQSWWGGEWHARNFAIWSLRP